MNYLAREQPTLPMARSAGPEGEVPALNFREALQHFDHAIQALGRFEVDVFALLGMRNLSAFVGELFCASVIKAQPGLFRKNPHQDGYPDLLLMDECGAAQWDRLAGRLRDKQPFSPFATGGLEVKATVGSVPSPPWFQSRNLEKPDIGQQRIEFLRGYDWKAHHRDTNNLVGLVWDFIDRAPSIVAVFYSHSLTPADWGAIVKPREGGGRTTSVSIMTRDGVRKMYEGWLLVADDERYTSFFNRHNSGDLIQRTENAAAGGS
jgi:hypothetical protein